MKNFGRWTFQKFLCQTFFELVIFRHQIRHFSSLSKIHFVCIINKSTTVIHKLADITAIHPRF